MAMNVLVAIGGTGARVAEAYIYAAASGLLGSAAKTQIFVVDKDIHCGNTQRLIKTINAYNEFRICTGLDLPEIEDCQWCIEEAMQELTGSAAQGTRVSYGQVAITPGTTDELLIDFLHSEEEKDFDLDKGFYGHPSLGAALYGMITQTNAFQGPANTLVDRIHNALRANGAVNTYFVGSMFGGTGASLLPNVARTLHSDPQIGDNANYRQAACLMLPYFKFQAPNGQQDTPVSFASFDEKTATALDFYARQSDFVSHDNRDRNDPTHDKAVFDDVYLFGRKPLEPTCPVYTLGGKDQTHTFTVVDFFAGLAAVEFFNGAEVKIPDGTAHLYSADMPTPCVSWPQVPSADAQGGCEQMLRFCYAFMDVLYPMFAQPKPYLQNLVFLKHIYGKVGLGGPAKLPADMDFGKEIQRIAPFCEKYMRFFVDLHRCNRYLAPNSCELFLPTLETEHLVLLDTNNSLLPIEDFRENYGAFFKRFRPDNLLTGQRKTRVPDAASLQDVLIHAKFDLNAYPGMKSIYRAAFDAMKVNVK